MLGTSYSLDTPSLSSLLEDCISSNYDLGTAYGRLRTVWNTDNHSTIQDELCRREENDREERRKALVGNRIVYPWLQPRFVWDLYSNRVVPRWIADSDKPPQPISHAWMDEKDRINVWTPINEREWPVPIPKDVNLNLVRIEMLNLGVEYTWLDVLCLRQEGGLKEDLRAEEWRLDVPTIGSVYESADQVVIYLSGLGKPLSLKAGDFDSDRCWFRRAWTLQEIGMWNRIIAGDTPDGPMYAEPIDEDGNYKTEILTIFHRQLEAVKSVRGLFGALENMRNRVSTNPVDKVAGLAFPLRPTTIPAYHESESLEDAWTALVNAMHPWMRVYFLFLYPDIGRGCKKWRPTWEQVMTGPLPANADWLGSVDHDDSTHVDWYEGPCIEKGLVQGLDVGSEGGDRYGELVVDGVDGMAHTFKILVTHQFPIPKDTYAMLGTHAQDYGNTIRDPQYWAIGRRLPEERFEKASVFIMNDLQEVKRLPRTWKLLWSLVIFLFNVYIKGTTYSFLRTTDPGLQYA
ncbi:uncharacterized protein EV420DRAFT_1270972 [Desarmillaria tabescens]|uniref:Heterokaryon incompatibility domain-containing protein n=1 Tax=Armillaria tabescens TaxID=1929756 RepID=A0AA39KAT0_ARMTA|nr:uncharacterized protein EV420DRAFT_1270972 [Desarmillaria tabescens]KAK0457739.1 hypothetical protein EV420DRAFT_1270972 [Desarmillaria tabescens]